MTIDVGGVNVEIRLFVKLIFLLRSNSLLIVFNREGGALTHKHSNGHEGNFTSVSMLFLCGFVCDRIEFTYGSCGLLQVVAE